MIRLIRNLIAPYRWTLGIVFVAMLLETAMSLAGPWPLKIVLDNVVGTHHLPGWLLVLWRSPPSAAWRLTWTITIRRAWVSGLRTTYACGLTTTCSAFPCA